MVPCSAPMDTSACEHKGRARGTQGPGRQDSGLHPTIKSRKAVSGPRVTFPVRQTLNSLSSPSKAEPAKQDAASLQLRLLL